MKYYLKSQLHYDWFKYLLIAVACFLTWNGIFSVANRYKNYETVEFFLCAQQTVESEQLTQLKIRAQQGGILKFQLDCHDSKSKEFPHILATNGIYQSDVLILDQLAMEQYLRGAGAMELTENVLDRILGENIEPVVEMQQGRPAALKIYDSKDLQYSSQFDTSFLKLVEGKYYLILNSNSYHVKQAEAGRSDLILQLCRIALTGQTN